jgi:glycerol-3-phosphate cytidylyltransferase
MSGVIGYSPGLFDLFHVGHLDLLRRAREACDHLIAGVLSDELAVQLWGHEPYVPLMERMDIVGNTRYVDEVVAVTQLDVRADWHTLNFDVLFTGRRRAGFPGPQELEAELVGTGSRVVIFADERQSESPTVRAALCRELPPRTSVA